MKDLLSLPPVARFVCLLLFGLGTAGHASASDNADTYRGAFSLVVENDTVTGSDNNYTNGIGLSWTSAEVRGYERDGFIAKWADFWSFLPVVGEAGSETYVSWTLGQEMHTPDDIEDPDPPTDDQPYAGVLYLDSTLYTRRERWHHVWGLRLGIVGPSSGAGHTQREYHELIGADDPLGWDTQLPDEPIVNLNYTVGCLLSQGKLGSASWRTVPIGNVSLGNYLTSIGGGIYAEIGWNLPRALGFSTLRGGLNTGLTAGTGPQKGWSVSFFAGASAHGVAHYLPLDGTVFKDSRSVNSEPLVGAVTGGVSMRYKRFAASFGVSYLTETFADEREGVNFGILNLALYY